MTKIKQNTAQKRRLLGDIHQVVRGLLSYQVGTKCTKRADALINKLFYRTAFPVFRQKYKSFQEILSNWAFRTKFADAKEKKNCRPEVIKIEENNNKETFRYQITSIIMPVSIMTLYLKLRRKMCQTLGLLSRRKYCCFLLRNVF